MIYKSRDIRWAKIRLMLCSSGWKRAKYLKKKQIFYAMGEDCYYHTRDLPAEPFLVKLHDDVRIAAGVRLITHDIASYMVNKMPEYEQIGKAHYYMCKLSRTCSVGLFYIENVEPFASLTNSIADSLRRWKAFVIP